MLADADVCEPTCLDRTSKAVQRNLRTLSPSPSVLCVRQKQQGNSIVADALDVGLLEQAILHTGCHKDIASTRHAASLHVITHA